jgi:hypothetical protein
MFYTQATLGKINKDVVTYFETEAAAKRAAKRQAKDKDYTAVWYGNPNRMEARVQVKWQPEVAPEGVKAASR